MKMKVKTNPIEVLLRETKLFLLKYSDGEYDTYQEYIHAAIILPKEISAEELENEFAEQYNDYRKKFPKTVSNGKRGRHHKMEHFYPEVFKQWLIEKGYFSIDIDEYESWQ